MNSRNYGILTLGLIGESWQVCLLCDAIFKYEPFMSNNIFEGEKDLEASLNRLKRVLGAEACTLRFIFY